MIFTATAVPRHVAEYTEAKPPLPSCGPGTTSDASAMKAFHPATTARRRTARRSSTPAAISRSANAPTTPPAMAPTDEAGSGGDVAEAEVLQDPPAPGADPSEVHTHAPAPLDCGGEVAPAGQLRHSVARALL